MSFAAPYLLLALVAVPVAAAAYVLLERQREGRANQWVSPAMAPNLVNRPSPRRRHIPAALFLIGLTFLLVGFARPEARLSSTREGATVVLTLDTSGSMAARDIKPTRLLAARNAIITFLQELPAKYKVGLVTFTDHPAVVVPPTYDRTKVRAALPLKAVPGGTAVGDAIQRSILVATQAVGQSRPGAPHPPAAILLLSDGSETSQDQVKVSVAAQHAKRANVPVSTVSLGTSGGTVNQVLTVAGGYKENKSVKVPAPDSTSLHSIAQATGGRFFAAKSAQELQRVYKDLGSHQAHTRAKHEVSAVATGLALVFILPAVLLSGVWFRRVA